MKKFILFTLMLSTFSVFSQENQKRNNLATLQNLTGYWTWTSTDNTEQFEIELFKVNEKLTGTHCSVVYNGRYIDCSYEDTSIELHQIETNIFEGTIRSGYSDTTGKIRITFDQSNNTVYFELLEEPSGVFYLPKDVVMK